MLDPAKFDVVCRSAEDVPSACARFVRHEFVAALGDEVGQFLPSLTIAFPRTVAAMSAHWSKPVLAAKAGVRRWVVDLVLERPDQNLFFELGYEGNPSDGPDFDDEHKMLPVRWRELYRKINSFQILPHSVPSIHWHNTPFSYSSRLDLDDYCDFLGVSAARGNLLARTLHSKHLRVWLVTDGRDALILDEQRCDGRVYHVRGDDFEDLHAVSNPGEKLDAYLAHVVSGGLPQDFEFRA